MIGAAPHQSQVTSLEFRMIGILILQSRALPDLREWSLAPNSSFGDFESRIISVPGIFRRQDRGKSIYA